MGQYYKIVNLTKKLVIESNSGLKLMEWNWIGNSTVSFLLSMLEDKWKEDRIIIVGDYYIENDDDYFGYNRQDFKQIREPGTYDVFYYGLFDAEKVLGFKEIKYNDNEVKQIKKGYFINETDKVFCDISKMPKDRNNWQVSPTILLACGNGRGGGDYRDCYPHHQHVGSWAGCNISFSKTKPDEKIYIEKVYVFIESE